MILAGDIGGTKTHLALYEPQSSHCIAEEKYHSREYKSLSEIIEKFISKHEVVIEKACLGVAGPIKHNVCRATNLPWVIDGKVLAEVLKTKHVWLVNDLYANAYGLKCLSPKEFFTLNEGVKDSIGNAALISAGTGLGEAGLYWDGKTHHPFACEGGHVDFAPRDQLEIDLWHYLRKKFEHVSYERVISGPGLYNLYRFLIDDRLENESDEIKEEMLRQDPSKVITEKAQNKQCPTCTRALDWFISIYGSEAGNLALKVLALGGVYIGGGIAPKILEGMRSGGFMKAFVAKGRFAPMLEKIPIKIVLNDNTALLGAAQYAREMQ